MARPIPGLACATRLGIATETRTPPVDLGGAASIQHRFTRTEARKVEYGREASQVEQARQALKSSFPGQSTGEQCAGEMLRPGNVTAEEKVRQSTVGRRMLLPAVASSLALWAAFAPLNMSLLAWLAPVGWLLLAEREAPLGRRGYFFLWIAGCLFWLLILHGIRLAFWPLIFGWILLSLYLAVYIPLFVGATRILRHQWQLPLVCAAPVGWVGMELIRSYLFTGFAGNTLAHSQAHWPMVIQLADQLGTGGVSMVMIMVSAAVVVMTRAILSRTRLATAMGSAALATSMLLALLGYGWWKLAEWEAIQAQRPTLLSVLLVQENTPTIFEYDPERNRDAWTRYLHMTRAGARKYGTPDLVVWPESTFTRNEPLREARLTHGLPQVLKQEVEDEAYLLQRLVEIRQMFDLKARSVINAARGGEAWEALEEVDSQASTKPYLLVGNDLMIYTSEGVERFNTAAFIGPDGQLIDHYSKMHLVMVGEYLPLGPALRWLGDLFGQVDIQAGPAAKSLPLSTPQGEVRLSPNICFESMVPQLISAQVRDLVRRGQSPDVLVNISNDSWFHGSSALDHHLASSILAAVENRRPMLVAANTGLTAEIAGSGQLLQCTQRGTADALLAAPKDGQQGGYGAVAGLSAGLGMRLLLLLGAGMVCCGPCAERATVGILTASLHRRGPAVTKNRVAGWQKKPPGVSLLRKV